MLTRNAAAHIPPFHATIHFLATSLCHKNQLILRSAYNKAAQGSLGQTRITASNNFVDEQFYTFNMREAQKILMNFSIEIPSGTTKVLCSKTANYCLFPLHTHAFGAQEYPLFYTPVL